MVVVYIPFGSAKVQVFHISRSWQKRKVQLNRRMNNNSIIIIKEDKRVPKTEWMRWLFK